MRHVTAVWLVLRQQEGVWRLAQLKLYQDIGRFMFPIVTPTVIH